jgi:hypothetical protein
LVRLIDAGGKFMKLLHAIAVSGALVMATVGAHAASFTGQTIDGVLTSNQTPGVTTQFTSPIVAPGAFDGVMQDVFNQIWDVNVQVHSNEVIVDWTGSGNGNVAAGADLLAVDLSGYTNGPVLKLESYSCTPTGFPCDTFSSGPSISGLTSTPTSFDVSFNVLRSGETYVFGVPEPATWAMMGLGFASLAFAGFRARRSAAAIG